MGAEASRERRGGWLRAQSSGVRRRPPGAPVDARGEFGVGRDASCELAPGGLEVEAPLGGEKGGEGGRAQGKESRAALGRNGGAACVAVLRKMRMLSFANAASPRALPGCRNAPKGSPAQGRKRRLRHPDPGSRRASPQAQRLRGQAHAETVPSMSPRRRCRWKGNKAAMARAINHLAAHQISASKSKEGQDLWRQYLNFPTVYSSVMKSTRREGSDLSGSMAKDERGGNALGDYDKGSVHKQLSTRDGRGIINSAGSGD